MEREAELTPYCIEKLNEGNADFLDDDNHISGMIRLKIREIKNDSVYIEMELFDEISKKSLARIGRYKISKPTSLSICGITAKTKVYTE